MEFRLPNYDDRNPLRVPSGVVSVLEPSATDKQDIVLGMKTLGCHAMVRLNKYVSLAELNDVSLRERMARVKPHVAHSSAPYTLAEGDRKYWHASLHLGASSARLGRGEGKVRIGIYKNEVDQRPSDSKRLFMSDDAEASHIVNEYYLAVYTELGDELLAEWEALLVQCKTVGEMAEHRSRSMLEQALLRNAARLLYDASEELGIALPAVPDDQSAYAHDAEYDAPLLINPAIVISQFHNTVAIRPSDGKVVIYNGAIDIRTLSHVTIMLGPGAGMALLTLGEAGRGIAEPIGVKRSAVIDLAEEHRLAPAYAGYKGRSRHLFKDAYDRMDEGFLSKCFELAGFKDHTMSKMKKLVPVAVHLSSRELAKATFSE